MIPPNKGSEDRSSSTGRRTFLGTTGAISALGVAGYLSSSAAADGHRADEENSSDEGKSSSVSVYEGITYAERDVGEMKLDLFVPQTNDPPLIVYFHGGGWWANTRDNVPEPKKYAEEWNCAIASVDYRLSEIPEGWEAPYGDPESNPTPRGVFPDHFVDVKASIRWLRANADEYGYDAERVAAWGPSAGGHLATLAGVVEDVTDLAGDAYSEDELAKEVAPDESGAVQAVIDWFGAHDLTRESGEEGSSVALLIGGPKSENEAEFKAASPVTHVSSDDPPMLFMHGRADQVVSIEQSRLMYDALDEVQVDSVLYELHNLNHVFAHGGLASIQPVDVAMDLLAADPTPAQSIYETTHIEEGGIAEPLIWGKPPAGPVAIKRFLDQTIRPDEGRGPPNGVPRGRPDSHPSGAQ